jgi:hypothetical protein
MAKNESLAKSETNNEQPVRRQRPAEAGFTNESRPDIDGWAKPIEGGGFYGIITSFFAFTDDDGKTKEVVTFKLLEDCDAMKDQALIRLKKGQTIAASMMHALEPIRSYIEKRGIVWVEFLKKEPLKGGKKSVWKADVYCKGEKTAPPRAVVQRRAPIDMPTSTEDEPF